MKTKTKTLALVEIAIVLCSVFLVALPVIGVAADQNQTAQKVSASEVTAASEDDFLLEIYGNANEDDCIDMRDYTYTARIICWLEDETTLADANYDGRISVADMTQIGLIILGRESELTFVDATDDVVTVDKPVKRIAVGHSSIAQLLRVLDATDMIVITDMYTPGMGTKFFPEISQLPDFGCVFDPDYEAILSVNPDIFMGLMESGLTPPKEEYEEKLMGVTVISPITSCLRFETEKFIEEVTKLGYVLDKEKEAEEFIDWHIGYLNIIEDRIEKLSADEKPRTYIECCANYYMLGATYAKMFDLIGAINIAADAESGYIEDEWLIAQNPEIIMQLGGNMWMGYSCGYDEDDPTSISQKIKEIMGRLGWVGTTAVKEEKVYIVDMYCVWEAPNFIIGTAYIVKWFHPDLFEDLDPKAIHQEYLDRFQRIDYDLDEHGVFLYPPIEIDGDLAGIPDKWL